MGYTTEFYGKVSVSPFLNASEVDYLRAFSDVRHMRRTKGPYYVGGGGFMGQDHEADVLDYNSPDPNQPGLWCQWVPTEDGTAIEWNGMEKFYNSAEWMRYLIDHFLAPDSVVAKLYNSDNPQDRLGLDPRFDSFGFYHVVNGVIEAQGEDHDDHWRLVVTNNNVEVQRPHVMWPATPFDEQENNW